MRKGSTGVSSDCPIFFEYHLLSQKRVKLRSSNLAGIHRVHANKTPLKFLGKGAWAYPGTAEILSQERVG